MDTIAATNNAAATPSKPTGEKPKKCSMTTTKSKKVKVKSTKVTSGKTKKVASKLSAPAAPPRRSSRTSHQPMRHQETDYPGLQFALRLSLEQSKPPRKVGKWSAGEEEGREGEERLFG